ncbi:MAG: hypothetical protein ACQEUM_07195 [Pseudomonadota bacterium]
MQYGVKPKGMTLEDWDIECQCRMIAREMRQGRDKAERAAIFERWQKALPAVSKARVAEIWRQGVPMPVDKVDAADKQDRG